MNAPVYVLEQAISDLKLEIEFGTVALIPVANLPEMQQSLELRIARIEEEIDIVSGIEKDSREQLLRELKECRNQSIARQRCEFELETDALVEIVDSVLVASIVYDL